MVGTTVRNLLVAAAVLVLAVGAAAQETVTRQLVDGIAAVVGDEIILESEVDEEFYIYQMRVGAGGLSEQDAARVRSGIIREMVDEMLLVAMAHRDTIELNPGELAGEMEQRIAELEERHGSMEALSAALAAEGLTLDQLKEIYSDEIERRLLAQRVVRREVHGRIDVTWGEVEDYYNEHADEVGKMPEAFQVGGILTTPKISEEAKREAIEKLTEASEKLAAGEAFENLAREYSDDTSAVLGGDIGRFGRGVMVPEFEDAAFALSEGEVSGIVPTRFGFHIIQVLEKSDDEVLARHILARVTPGPEDEERARATADSLKERALSGEDFAELARARSDDPSSRDAGGELGWFARDDLAPLFLSAIEGLGPGDIADVVLGDTGFYVLKLIDHREARVAELDEVREDLKDYLFSLKAEERYTELMEQLKSEIFVDIRTDLVQE